MIKAENNLTAVGLFTGCGGSSLGVKLAGFHEKLAIDFDQNSVECHHKNFVDTQCLRLKIDESPENGDIRTSEVIRRVIGADLDLDLLQMSPPCQVFSMCNTLGFDIEKIKPFYDSIQIVTKVRPKVFIIENVRGVLADSRSRIWNELRAILHQSGYTYDFKVLKASDYGVPQERYRLFIVGVRPDLVDMGYLPVFPKPYKIDKRLLSMKNVLPNPPKYFSMSQFTDTLNSSDKICHTLTKTPNLKFYDGIDKEPRKPTIDDLKILSSFPLDFIFPGSYTDAVNRIGNCVPPYLMLAVARAIRVGILDPFYQRTTPS